ncbi:MAG: hypothetical protein V3T70_08720 [Phycisphaerae bacterium]
MPATIGPLLSGALSSIRGISDPADTARFTARLGNEADNDQLPIILALRPTQPRKGEGWTSYRRRVLRRLKPLQEEIEAFGARCAPLIAANAVQAQLSAAAIKQVESFPDVEAMELDPLVQATAMDDA